MKPTIIAIISFLFVLVSCGKSESTQSVKLRIVSAAMFSQIPNAGGVIVVGRTLDDKNSFSKTIKSDSDIVDLPKGSWEFFAIAWEGNAGVTPNKNLTGAHRCAYSGIVKIDKDDVAVTFNMSQAACALPISDGTYVADPAMMSGSQFKSITFTDCSLVPNPVSESSCYPTGQGRSKSFRIRIPDIVETNGVQKIVGGGLLSRCIEESQYYHYYNYLTLPLGSGDNGFVNFAIESFDQPGCVGSLVTSKYSHNEDGALMAKSYTSGSNAYLFFPHFNPYASLGYDDTGFGGVVNFNTCHTLIVKLKDAAGNPIVADAAYPVNTYFLSKGLFFNDNTCARGTGSMSATYTIAAGASSVPVYFKSFGMNANFSVDIYPLAIGFSYTQAVNTATYNIAALGISDLKDIAAFAEGTSSIIGAHTMLFAGSVFVIRYDNVIAKLEVISIDTSSINFNFYSYDYTTEAPITSGVGIYLDAASNEICDLTAPTCNVATYTGSDPGYHFIYNSINNLGVYSAGPSRSMFNLQ